jgi:two-component system response regulator FixJ
MEGWSQAGRDNSHKSMTENNTVFIIDPDEAHRREVALLLNTLGFSTFIYRSAEDFLNEEPHQTTGSCIISEVHLPGMNGLDLVRTLRKRKHAPPIIILTRDSDVSRAVEAFRISVTGYLIKPYVERKLVNTVRGALNQADIPAP